MLNGEQDLNFVETMALYRLFSVGRLNCSGIKPKISVANFLGEGYVLKITKKLATKYCINCVRDFSSERRLRVSEDKNYLTIQIP